MSNRTKNGIFSALVVSSLLLAMNANATLESQKKERRLTLSEHLERVAREVEAARGEALKQARERLSLRIEQIAGSESKAKESTKNFVTQFGEAILKSKKAEDILQALETDGSEVREGSVPGATGLIGVFFIVTQFDGANMDGMILGAAIDGHRFEIKNDSAEFTRVSFPRGNTEYNFVDRNGDHWVDRSRD